MDFMNQRFMTKEDPSNVSVSKLYKKEPITLKLHFTNTDAVADDDTVTSSNNNYQFNIEPHIFDIFDQERPVFFLLDGFVATESLNALYSLVWKNMPCSHQSWFTQATQPRSDTKLQYNSEKNILGVFYGNNSSQTRSTIPYVIPNIQHLKNLGRWYFRFSGPSHGFNITVTDFFFTIAFYQN